MAVQVLEQDFGYHFWLNPEVSLAQLCENQFFNAADCLARIARLPEPAADTDWDAKPAYWLVDYLVRNHESFRGKDMPAIQTILSEARLPAYPDGYIVKLLIQEYHHFQIDFLKHMAEEEDFLFARILRDEACIRHPELGPEAHLGSVSAFLKSDSHKPEEEFKRMIVSIREKLRLQSLQKPASELAQRAQVSMDGFADRLTAHADLETNVLFPRAERMERELSRRPVPGLIRYLEDQ